MTAPQKANSYPRKILLAARRPRKDEKERRYVFNTVAVRGKIIGEVEYETDRNAFIGRGNTLREPQALKTGLPLSNTAGNIPDPIMSLRVGVSILPGRSAAVIYVTGISDSREKAVEMGTRYQNAHAVEDVFKMALFDSQIEMQYLGVTSRQVNAIQDLVGSIYYPSRLLRAPSDIIEKNELGQPDLWKFGISGDHPILLFRIRNMGQIGVLKDAVQAYEYLRKNGIRLDFVILNEETDDYYQPLNESVSDIISNRKIYYPNMKNPDIFLLKARNMSRADIRLLLTVARVVLSEKDSLHTGRIKKLLTDDGGEAPCEFSYGGAEAYEDIPLEQEGLDCFNGIGGFAKDGKEYVILLKDGHETPAPWINIISNEAFGFIVSASGSGYTWSVNSRENKITGWTNDPVTDRPMEIFYIRDDATGEFFSPTPSPVRERGHYRIRHGFGYTVFEHNSHGIRQDMTLSVSGRDPIKICRISLGNSSGRGRDLSVYFYVEWVLGVSRDKTVPYIVTEMDEAAGVLTARNTYSTDFRNRIAFISSSEKIASFTGDRGEFIGKGGNYGHPRGLLCRELSGKTGAALDACGAIKVSVHLEPGGARDVVFVIGQAADRETAVLLAETYRRTSVARAALAKARSSWKQILEQIQVNTPDSVMNTMLNGWILYQVVSCRMLARTSFYQNGGAYGFRDQLQDVMPLFHAMPGLARGHILRCCGRQFKEGDVQHWWHEDSGRGIRTRVSDDFLWLPYVTAAYIKETGDTGILDEEVPYLDGRGLEQNETEKYFIPTISEEKGSVYDHCIRAIGRAMRFGERGLPL